AVADQFRRGAWVFRESEGERTQNVKTGARLWITRLPVLQHRIEIHGRTDGRKRTRPTPPHGVGHARANSGSLVHDLLLDPLHEIFEILEGDTIPRASAHDPLQVRRC